MEIEKNVIQHTFEVSPILTVRKKSKVIASARKKTISWNSIRKRHFSLSEMIWEKEATSFEIR